VDAHPEDELSAYVIVEIEVTDPVAYEEYRMIVVAGVDGPA
jgi:uncharacterized protein (DUF1330 family)